MHPTSSSTEDYLKAILLEHEAEGARRIPPGRLAERLGVAPGSVTAMLKSLAVRALVHYEPYGGVALTAEGQRIAVAVLRRHRLIELFLVDVLGMDWSEVHAEAERLEHHVSERVLSRIDAVLGSPSVDPHGDPIPSSDGQLVAAARSWSLTECSAGAGARVVRVVDQAQDFLRLLGHHGIQPGAIVRIVSRDPLADALTVHVDGAQEEPVTLGFRAAARIRVVAVDASRGG